VGNIELNGKGDRYTKGTSIDANEAVGSLESKPEINR
jgi:hypothetical protein